MWKEEAPRKKKKYEINKYILCIAFEELRIKWEASQSMTMSKLRVLFSKGAAFL